MAAGWAGGGAMANAVDALKAGRVGGGDDSAASPRGRRGNRHHWHTRAAPLGARRGDLQRHDAHLQHATG